MSRRRTIIRLSAVLASLALGWACGGDSATAPPTPEPARPTTVTVSPATHGLTAFGATVQLSAEVRDQNARVMAGATVTWTSSANSVATVDASGLVTAAGNGTATITASAGSASGSAVVTVMQSVASVEVSPSVYELTALGQTVQLTAEAFDENGHAVAGAEFSWESSDAAVATVDAGGLVTAVAEGVATITASAGEASGSAVVPVMQPVASVEVSPSAQTIELGSTLQLTAEAFDENGEAVAGAEFSWESSDAAVAAVDAGGLVTGVAVGAATITATAGSAQGTAEITVGPNPDRAALVALYEATDGPNWVNSENWLTDAPLAEWYGVDTDTSGRVVRLDLAGRWDPVSRESVPHGLTGPIPPELGDLANLEVLNLWSNDLSGPIPAELGNLSNLTALRLGKNYLTSPIPPELGNLHKLRDLNLSEADLGGPIPPELGNLSQLLSLSLGTNAFRGSIPLELTRIPGLRVLRLGTNNLTGTIPPELADLAELEHLSLFQNELEGAIPSDLGNLPQLRTLLLSENRLSGPIPPELGTLPNLETLWLEKNNLSGLLPPELLQLNRIRNLTFADNATLCAPGTAPFVDWIEGIQETEGPFCNESDIAILESLYAAAGGASWTNSDNWLGGAALAEWHGIETDAIGRVQVMDLSHNGLAGRIPESLGGLTTMTKLQISGNAVSGRLPLSLVRLPLEALRYADTSLCVPTDEWFQEWLNAIPSHEGTGVECAPPSDRDVLVSLYDATGGPMWTNSGNWLTDAPLGEWYGVTTQTDGSVLALFLGRNNLSGQIPPEFGNLANLNRLDLGANRLSGVIPAELGTLRSLDDLRLAGNNLSGPIPPELGNLANLNRLDLGANRLSGPIPPELGNLANLNRLDLGANRLSGPIPAELGGLTSLSDLRLDNNDLTGSVPGGFGELVRVQTMTLSHNPRLSGSLPLSIVALAQLETLLAGGTGLCAPSDASFQQWLEGIHERRIASCATTSPHTAYLTQAVQSREFPVPLVAGEKALLRVFMTAASATGASIPSVRARFYRNGRETHVEDIPGKSSTIPTEVGEGSLSKSANAEIPAEIVQPGLEMVVEVDPEGTLDPALGVTKRIPEAGRMAIDVRSTPLFDLTLIPFLWTEDPDLAILTITSGMAAEPEAHELLGDTRTLLPVGIMNVTAHEPVLHSTKYAGTSMLGVTAAIRAMEGAHGHYLGMISHSGGKGGGGYANLGGKVAVAGPKSAVIAHELGHTLNLLHAPCGHSLGGVDPSFPYPDGSSGAWGYDFRNNGRLVSPDTPDLMSYCGGTSNQRGRTGNQWISDYHFTNALRYRLFDEGTTAAATESLLLWGGVAADSVPYLEPVFVVDAPPTLPDSAGEHRITGRTANGRQLFSFSFAMPEVADGDGSSSFAFVLPARPGWADALASITLLGPGGSVTVDRESDLSMAILRNPRNGQVRGILRDLPPATQAAREAVGRAAGPGLEVLFSRGIPDVAAWRR